MKIKRRKTRAITVGGVEIGGGAPVVVQSMTKTRTEDVKETVAQVNRIERTGCEIIRVAIPHKKALAALPGIIAAINIPLIADIHFQKDFAIGALEAGAACVRINPGNLGGIREFNEVAKAAAKAGKAVRIGVNAGSLQACFAKKKGLSESEKMVASAVQWCEAAEKCKLENYKVSLKSSGVLDTVEAYRIFSKQSDAPLHIGITEAGDEFSGAIKSSVGLGLLLADGIGDTMRVSLTGPPEREVEAAYEILRALDLRHRGIEYISCPTCARCEANVAVIVKQLKAKTRMVETPLKVAVMGCEVNGPGEAKAADLGVALNRAGGGVLFIKGEKTQHLKAADVLNELLSKIEKMV